MVRRLLTMLLLVGAIPQAMAEVNVQAVKTLINGDAEVPAAQYSYYDLTLTEGEELVVDVRVVGGLDNSLTIWLIDLANFQRFKAGQRFSYFEGGSSARIQSSASYRFEVPSDNIYYLILDNQRAALATRTVQTYAYKVMDGETEESKQTRDFYSGMYSLLLKKLFVFDDFDIYVQMCGTANAFSSPDIYICRELNDLLFEQRVPEALMFVFLHEAAHSLLYLWDYPLYDNEDAADELATALLLLTEQKASALAAARWWANNGSAQEALAKMWVDDRHTVSPQRARNIVNWINNDGELVRRWLHLLMPKMTDEAVQALVEEGFGGIDQRVAKQELMKRQALQGHE